jgi:hypothetical protein
MGIIVRALPTAASPPTRYHQWTDGDIAMVKRQQELLASATGDRIASREDYCLRIGHADTGVAINSTAALLGMSSETVLLEYFYCQAQCYQ